VNEKMRIIGRVSYRHLGPNGEVIAQGKTSNIVTDKGDALFSTLAYTAAPTFEIKLGKTATAPSKTYNNAGGFIPNADSEADAQRAMDATYPKAGASANIVQFQTTYPITVATETWNRVALVDATESDPADGTLTYAIALLDPKPVAKGAADTLEVTWEIEFVGS
jgi:hypothetical protein